MKLETSGNVIGFPGIAARGNAAKRQHDLGMPDEQQAKSGFLSMLRSNIEDAEQLVSSLEPGEERAPSELEASRREGMVDTTYFGTLIGAVATKMASASLGDMPADEAEIPAVPSFQVIDKARQFLMDDDEAPDTAETAETGKAFGKALRNELAPPAMTEADDTAPAPTPVKVLELNLPEQAEAQANALKSNSFVIQGEPKIITPKGVGHSGHDGKPDAVANETESSTGTVVPFRGALHADAKSDSRSSDQGASDQSDDQPDVQVQTASVQTDADLFTTKAADRSPTQQIADNIRQAVPALQSQPLHNGEKAATIRFKLQPENLGDVEVRLKIRGDKLEVGIIMERGDAAGSVRQAQDDLRKSLSEQGLTLDMIDVSLASRPVREASASSQSDLMQQGNQQPSRQDAQAGSSGGASYGRSGMQSGSQGNSGAGREDGNGNLQRFAEEPVPRSVRSGVFL